MVASRARMLAMRAATAAAMVGGAYALHERTRRTYEPSMVDYMQATMAVTKGVFLYQPPPVEWASPTREILESSDPRPEVSGVNRSLHEYGADLREEELALFMAQAQHKVNPFNPGIDLAAERLISHSFAEEHRELMEKGKIAEEAGLSEEALAPLRKQAAAAKVGELAHFTYGAIKSTFSYGAATEDDLGAGTYNEMVTEASTEYIQAKAKEQLEQIAQTKASIASTKSMKQSLHDIVKPDSPSAEEQSTYRP